MNILYKAVAYLGSYGYLRFLPDELYLKIYYKAVSDKKLSISRPILFTEKLQYLKLHDRKDVYTVMVDKHDAKKWVEELIGKQYVIPTIALYDSADDIDIAELPNQFVMKTTHDSGTVIVCKNKADFEVDKSLNRIRKSLKTNFFIRGVNGRIKM